MELRDVALLILKNAEGKILLQKRPKDANRFPDSWGLFGGGLKLDESPEEALRREVREELGLEIVHFSLIGEHPYVLRELGERGRIFSFEAPFDDSPLTLREGQEMSWFGPEEALRLGMHPIYLAIVLQIVQKRSSMVS